MLGGHIKAMQTFPWQVISNNVYYTAKRQYKYTSKLCFLFLFYLIRKVFIHNWHQAKLCTLTEYHPNQINPSAIIGPLEYYCKHRHHNLSSHCTSSLQSRMLFSLNWNRNFNKWALEWSVFKIIGDILHVKKSILAL